MIKKLLILFLVISIQNAWSKPASSLATKYDRVQDKKIIRNTKSTNRETRQRKQRDIEITNRVDTNKKGISNTSRNIESLDNRLSELEETQYVAEAEVRVYDGRRLTVSSFVRHSFTRNKLDVVGIRFTIKIGQSYEERLIAQQSKRLEKIEKQLGIRTQYKVVGKTKNGWDIVAEPNGVVSLNKKF